MRGLRTIESWHENLGFHVIRFMRELGGMSILCFQALSGVRKYRFRSKPFLDQLYGIGVGSLLVILNTGAFIGMVMAVQSYYQFRQFDLESGVGTVVGLTLMRELGPFVTALILSGRVGASMAAELGTMRVTEQIDALYTLGTNPVHYLVIPRFVACLIMLPLLTIFTNAIGIFTSYLLSVEILGVVKHYYLLHMFSYVDPRDLMTGLFKSIVFGGIIAIVGCYKGFYASGGAQGVGRAATGAVVWSCMLVLIMDFFMSLAMY